MVSPHFGLLLMLLIFSLVSHDCTSSSKSVNSGIRPEGSHKLLPLSKVPELFHSPSPGCSEASLTFWWIHRDGLKSHLQIRVSTCVHVCVCMYAFTVSAYMHVYMCEVEDFRIVPLDQLG